MNDFGRVLRLAMRHRWTFAASILCALAIAALWGGNITAIYPVVEVVFQGKSLHEWIDEQIADTQQKLTVAEQSIADADARLESLPDAANSTPGELSALARRRREAVADRERYAQRKAQYVWANERLIGPWLPRDPFLTLVVVIVGLAGGTLVKSLFTIAHSILCDRLSQLATFQLRRTFYRRTLHMELASFQNEGSGDLMNRFTSDVDSVANGLNELFGKLIREPLKMLACLIGAAWVCWRLLLFSLILAPAMALLVRWLARSLKRANRRAMEEMSQIYGILEETFQGIKVVKAFTMERQERRRFHQACKNYYFKSMRIAYVDSLTRPVTELLGIMTVCLAVLAGAYLALNQNTHLFGIRMSYEPLGLSELMLFYAMLIGTSDPARKLSDVFSRLQRGAAAATRVYQLLDREPTIVDPPHPSPLGRHRRELVLDNVQFQYATGTRVLEDINLRIAWGETVAIVGPNGCGKSTLVNLIPRFYDPVAGQVRLDGVNVRNVRLRHLRGQIGLVTQETLLFDDTVYNNIRYGSPQATRAEVLAAAQQAHAHRFIEERLDASYETMVGPRGSMLSGGQRQRIALARAILRDPALMILDEATSQVDLESEQLIHKVLEKFTQGRTTLIITHRMSTLSLADRIVVMDQGRILDIGSHDELLRRCELYGRLHDIQFKKIA